MACQGSRGAFNQFIDGRKKPKRKRTEAEKKAKRKKRRRGF